MNDWEEKLRQEINDAGVFLESDVESLILIVKEMIREAFQELWNGIPDVYNLSWSACWSALDRQINKILQSKGIKEI